MARTKSTVKKAMAGSAKRKTASRKAQAKTPSANLDDTVGTDDPASGGRPKRTAKSKALSVIDSYLQSESSEDDDDVGDGDNDSGAFGELGFESSGIASEMVDVPEASDVPGFDVWKTNTKLVSGSGLTQVSQYNVRKSKFTQAVDVEYGEMFTLKPLIINEGPLKGRRVLMLEPVSIDECFPFLKLPPELRKMVYDIVLLQSHPAKIGMTTHKPVGRVRRPVHAGFRHGTGHKGMIWDGGCGKWIGQPPSNFSLLRVNKQLFHETAPIVYGHHTFEFDAMKHMDIFLSTIGSMRKYLKHLSLGPYSWDSAKTWTIFNMLKDAKSLRTLTFAHRTVCINNGRRWDNYRRASVENLVIGCLPLLKTLHEARHTREDDFNVLDVILITTKACRKCENPMAAFVHSCEATACGVPCSESAEHHEEYIAKLRKLIAKGLEIKS